MSRHYKILYKKLKSANSRDDFENFVKLVYEYPHFFDDKNIELGVRLLAKIIISCRIHFYECLVSFLSPLHVYHALKSVCGLDCIGSNFTKILEKEISSDALQHTYFPLSFSTNLEVMNLVLGKGLDPNLIYLRESNLLHSALINFSHRTNASEYLSQGKNYVECLNEIISMLLYYGADCSYIKKYESFGYNDALKLISRLPKASDFIFEQIFLHTFDDLPQTIPLSTLLEVVTNTKKYSETKNRLIHKMFDYKLEFILEDREVLFETFMEIDFDWFKVIVRRFPNVIRTILEETEFRDQPYRTNFYSDFLKMMEYLLSEGSFFNEVVDFFEKTDELKICKTDTGLMLFMIQYGLKCDTRIYHTVYENWGDCELFRTLLHLDVEERHLNNEHKNVMASFITDVNLTVETIIDSISQKKWTVSCNPCHLKTLFGYLTENKAIDLLDFFTDSKLIDFLLSTENLPSRVLEKIELVPNVPSLQELSRDSFRKHLIDRFHVKSTKQFYSIISGLPIAADHRKIICFEKKLHEITIFEANLDHVDSSDVSSDSEDEDDDFWG